MPFGFAILVLKVAFSAALTGMPGITSSPVLHSLGQTGTSDVLTPFGSTNPFMKSFVYPVMSPQLSSRFGLRVHPIRKYSSLHKGVDLAAPSGSPIRAISEGMVVFADPYAGYGNLVVIKHPSGATSHYGHCQSIRVRPGQRVRAGDIIGTVGSSGHSTGPHLHLELRIDGKPINPASVIPALDGEAQG